MRFLIGLSITLFPLRYIRQTASNYYRLIQIDTENDCG
jgi:hypothetical protein